MQLDERLPQVLVRHRLALAVLPIAFQPSLPPAVPEAVHDVGRVADDLQRALEPSHRIERGAQLHPLVGRHGLGAGGERPVGDDPGPSARPGVAGAGAVCVHGGSGFHPPHVGTRIPVTCRSATMRAMFSPIRSLYAIGRGASAAVLLSMAASTAMFAATPFLLDPIADEFGVRPGAAGTVSVVQVGAFALANLLLPRILVAGVGLY